MAVVASPTPLFTPLGHSAPTHDAIATHAPPRQVGIAVTVSVIVLLLLMALIFVCLKKTAPKTELVGVLKPGASQEDAAANQA